MTPPAEQHTLDARLDKILDQLLTHGNAKQFAQTGQMPEGVMAQIELYQAEQMIHHVKAETARQIARWRLASIARDLAPIAAGYARRGRPRLLATLARLLEEPTPPVSVTAKSESRSGVTSVILQKNKVN